jgi:hypothetical protein
MDKKFLISWLVIFILWMAGSFVIHGLLLKGDYLALPFLFRSEEDAAPYFYLMLIAHVVMAGAFTWMYSRGIENKDWLGQGIRFGIAVALLAVVPVYMIYFVVQPMPSGLAIKQSIFDSVLMVILGIVASYLYRDLAGRDRR